MTAATMPCPRHLTGLARVTWPIVVRELTLAGQLGADNARVIERYVTLYARWREAESHLATEGAITAAPRTGTPMHNPWLSVSNAAADRLARMEAEMGLTPAARKRLGGFPRPPGVGQGGADGFARLKALQGGKTV